jgi:hypothetical protein
MFNLPMIIALPHEPHPKQTTKKPLHQRIVRERIESTLGNIGGNISKSFLYASTYARKGVKHEEWWIQVGNPLVFIEFNKEDPYVIPSWLKPLTCSDDDIDLFKYIHKDGCTITYIIKRKNHNKAREKSRILRLILSALHCHYSNIASLLANMGKDRLNVIDTTMRAIRVREDLTKEKENLCKFISKAAHYNIEGVFDENHNLIEMPMPYDAAKVDAIIQKIDFWQPAEPSFIRKFAYDFVQACEKDIDIVDLIKERVFKN